VCLRTELISKPFYTASSCLRDGEGTHELAILSGFGSFEVLGRPAYKGRNPSTGEKMQIGAFRIPTFRAGARLKAAVNGK
jgi:nucleoid DNA-binding protein